MLKLKENETIYEKENVKYTINGLNSINNSPQYQISVINR